MQHLSAWVVLLAGFLVAPWTHAFTMPGQGTAKQQAPAGAVSKTATQPSQNPEANLLKMNECIEKNGQFFVKGYSKPASMPGEPEPNWVVVGETPCGPCPCVDGACQCPSGSAGSGTGTGSGAGKGSGGGSPGGAPPRGGAYGVPPSSAPQGSGGSSGTPPPWGGASGVPPGSTPPPWGAGAFGVPPSSTPQACPPCEIVSVDRQCTDATTISYTATFSPSGITQVVGTHDCGPTCQCEAGNCICATESTGKAGTGEIGQCTGEYTWQVIPIPPLLASTVGGMSPQQVVTFGKPGAKAWNGTAWTDLTNANLGVGSFPNSSAIQFQDVWTQGSHVVAVGMKPGDNSYGVISRSSDGGKTWTALVVEDGLFSIGGENAQQMYAVGGNYLFRTTNGWSTWTQIDVGAQSSLQKKIYPKRIWTMTHKATKQPLLYLTAQGSGATNMLSHVLVSPDEGDSWLAIHTVNHLLTEIYGTPDGTIYAAGTEGRVYRLQNGSWKQFVIPTPATHDVVALWAHPQGNLYAVVKGTGANIMLPGYIATSTDQGVNWKLDPLLNENGAASNGSLHSGIWGTGNTVYVASSLLWKLQCEQAASTSASMPPEVATCDWTAAVEKGLAGAAGTPSAPYLKFSQTTFSAKVPDVAFESYCDPNPTVKCGIQVIDLATCKGMGGWIDDNWAAISYEEGGLLNFLPAGTYGFFFAKMNPTSDTVLDEPNLKVYIITVND